MQNFISFLEQVIKNETAWLSFGETEWKGLTFQPLKRKNPILVQGLSKIKNLIYYAAYVGTCFPF